MENFIVDTQQAGEQASGFQFSSLRQTLLSFLVSYFSKICYTSWAIVYQILNNYFCFLLKFGSTTFMYHGKTFRQHFTFSISQQLISVKKTFVVFYVDQLVHLLVCLVCQETMAVENFDFRGNSMHFLLSVNSGKNSILN